MSKKKHEGVVYSTDPDFVYETEALQHPTTLPPEEQTLYIWLDSKSRKGKTVTLIKGYKGDPEDLESLTADLKKTFGAGGSVKDGEIIIQGNFRDRLVIYLTGMGYRVKKAGS